MQKSEGSRLCTTAHEQGAGLPWPLPTTDVESRNEAFQQAQLGLPGIAAAVPSGQVQGQLALPPLYSSPGVPFPRPGYPHASSSPPTQSPEWARAVAGRDGAAWMARTP
jgi:hypothetical protein